MSSSRRELAKLGSSPGFKGAEAERKKIMASGNTRNRQAQAPEFQALWEETQLMLLEHDKNNAQMRIKNARVMSLEGGWEGLKPEEIPYKEADEVSRLYHELIALEEKNLVLLEGSEGTVGIKTKLGVIEALREEAIQGRASNKRGNNLAKPLPDMDGAADSAASSPALGGGSRIARPYKMGSQPPKDVKDTPVKREDSEVPDVPVKTGKIVFAVGQQVAFKQKPKNPGGSEEADWIQGKVVKVIGEGKSRRYDVEDIEPEKIGNKLIIRTWASSMVPIPALGAPLPEYPKGKHVLARYPDTTTFYRAEVAGNTGNEVMLKFEGEEDKERVLNVDRRFVLDHRG